MRKMLVILNAMMRDDSSLKAGEEKDDFKSQINH